LIYKGTVQSIKFRIDDLIIDLNLMIAVC